MAKLTTEFGFTKPEPNDFYNIDELNANWDKVDTLLRTIANLCETRMDAHTKNQSNPHKVTAQQIGAAPAYTYGAEDIEEGSASEYEDGHIHFIYEA